MKSELVNVRNFEYSEIQWKIKNYFSATCAERWKIVSPVFTVNGKTCSKWRLYLMSKHVDGKCNVFAYLDNEKRDAMQEPAWVIWKLFFSPEISGMVREAKADFEKGKSLIFKICDADDLEYIMERLAEDTLIIRSSIFVCSKDSQVYKRSKDLGLKSLSQDMSVLYRVGKNYDLTLRIGGVNKTFTHKGILSARNNVLKRAIEIERDGVTQLSELNMDDLQDVFGYLYTGNLDYVLRKPSLSMLECINRLDIKELKEYYEPDEFELCSEYRMKECKFDCFIPLEKISHSNMIICYPVIRKDSSLFECIQITDSDEVISSPRFYGPPENFFTLCFYPKGLYGKSDYMSIFLEDVEKYFSKTSYVEVGVMHANGNILYLQRRRCSSYSDEISFESLLPKVILKDSAIIYDENLHLVCNFYTPVAGSRTQSIIRNKVRSNRCIDPEKHYNMLSDQMSTLFETGVYSDFTLTCDGIYFRVHSYILCARSHVFRDIFDKHGSVGNSKSLNIFGVKSNILRAILYYIYSGKLLKHEIHEILLIYEAAVKFCLLPLIYTCSKILQENLGLLDTKRVLSLAEQFKDYKLIAALRKFNQHKTSDC